MRTLKFILDGQKLKKDPSCDFTGLICGTMNYVKLSFDVSGDWNKCFIIVSFLDENDHEIDASELKNFECLVPNTTSSYKKYKIRLIGCDRTGNCKIISSMQEIRQKEK